MTDTQPNEPVAHGDKVCQECGGDNPVWSAPDLIWNRIVGSPNGVLCPTCFMRKAPDQIWRVCEAPDASADTAWVDELERLAKAATPGRWQNGIEDLEGVVAPDNPGLGNVICIPPKRNMYSSLECWPANATYIAAANPATVLSLIEQIRRAEAERDALREALEPFAVAADRMSTTTEDGFVFLGWQDFKVTIGDFRAALAALPMKDRSDG